MKLDLQRFGGRGATSQRIDGIQALSNRAKDIMREWARTQSATEKSEEEMRKELNKRSYDQLLKLAQRTDEADISRAETGTAFAIQILQNNIIEVGQRKNSSKWSVDFGRWRNWER